MITRPEKATRIGSLVGAKYRIVRMIAEGGMGVVYEAQHTVVRRRFAVKFLRPDLAERRDILNRFQREAEAAGALESEHVAAAVDFGIVPDGTPYIVMEYLVGESLAALLEREGRLSVARAADLVAQASRGIEVAHASGIIHRDLKPQNLFVCRRQDGTDLLKILDFGVAKLQAIDEMNAATRTGTVLGTVAYMSPEQARGDKIVDQRSDVYALGAILYELVSQKKPHPGESHNAVLHHIATHPAVPIESVQPGLPAGFAEIVGRTLSCNTEERPPSAEAFAQALVPFAERAVWPAPKFEDSGANRVEVTSTLLVLANPGRPTPLASSLAGVTVDDRVTAMPAPQTPTSSRSRLRPLVAVGVAIAIVVLVLVAGVGSRRSIVAAHDPGNVSSKRALAPSPGPLPPAPNSGAVQGAGAAAPAANAVRRPFASTLLGPADSTSVKPDASTFGDSAPLPAAGPSGGTSVRAGRRHGSSTRPSDSVPSFAASSAPAGRSASVPITFDQENPYK
jgi:serine/threonine-protein kinase